MIDMAVRTAIVENHVRRLNPDEGERKRRARTSHVVPVEEKTRTNESEGIGALGQHASN